MIRVLSFLFILSFALWTGVALAGDAAVDVEACSEPDPVIDIPDGDLDGVEDVLDVLDDITIFDLDVSVDLTHDWQGDVEMTLTSPATTAVTLADNLGGSNVDFLGFYNDEGSDTNININDTGKTVDGPGLLSDFDDESTDGEWTLLVVDTGTSFGSGTINGWCLLAKDCDLVAPSDFTCEQVDVEDAPFDVELTWTNDASNYDSIDVLRNGTLLSSEKGDATSYTDVAPGNGLYTYTLAVSGEGGSCEFNVECAIEAGYSGCLDDTPVDILDAHLSDHVSTLNITDVIFIGDVEALVTTTLDFHENWVIDQESPAGTVVTLHNETTSSGFTDEINVSYNDDGVAYGDDDLACGCLQAPNGPGTMGDYADSFADGDWTLTLSTANASFNDGTLDAWCLAFVAQCPVTAPTGLTCTAENDDVTISWTNEQEYDDITVICNGEEIATIDGDDTSYTDQNLPGGVYYYSVVGINDADGCGRESEECFADRGFIELCGGSFDLAEGDNSDTLSISAGQLPAVITGIAMTLDASDANIGDLFVEVTSAAGTTVTLFDDAADTGTSIDLLYTDGGQFPAAPYDCACPTRPVSGSLDDILALDPFINGFWTLSVSNAVGDDGDAVNDWCVLIGEEVPQRGFKRGDVDGNNTVVALIDALSLLDFGFNGGPEPTCNDAADVNGNNLVEVLVDTLDLLMWQYGGGDEPASPGPFFCGFDDDVEFDADCDVESCAP